MNRPEDKNMLDIIADNIIFYLSVNHLSEKEAARVSGIKLTTLNNWIRKKTFPREENLKKLTDALGVSMEEFRKDHSDPRSGRHNYMTIGQNELLRCYEENADFRRYVDTGMQALRAGTLSELLESLN